MTMRDLFESLGYTYGKRISELPQEAWVALEGYGEALTSDLPPDEPACTTCLDQVWVVVDTPGHPLDGRSIPCPMCEAGRARQAQRDAEMLANSGLPARFRDLTFDTWARLSLDEQRGKELAFGAAWLFARGRGAPFTLGDIYAELGMGVEQFPEPARCSLVFYGEVGMGKTGLAGAIVNALLPTSPVLYTRVKSLIRAIQDTYSDEYEGESAKAILDRVMTAPYLILDEFTLDKITDDRSEIMEDIVRFRCGRDLPFVVTTNTDPDRFRSLWGERIADVMLESCHWIPLMGVSLRNKQQVAVR